MFFFKKLDLTKTTSKNYIAGLQDPLKDKYMNGKSNYKLKSLQINASCNWYNVCKWKDYQNIFILSILTMKHKRNAFKVESIVAKGISWREIFGGWRRGFEISRMPARWISGRSARPPSHSDRPRNCLNLTLK